MSEKRLLISADSTVDLPPELIRAYRIHIIPSYVTMGKTSYDDWPNLTCTDLFRFYQTFGIMPKTAANSPERYQAWFQKLSKAGKPIIHIAKSSGISSCCDHAKLAASEMDHVYVVDSQNLSGGSGLLTLLAAQSDTDDPVELCALLEDVRQRIDGSFILETLEYLQKGGRCSSLSALGANVLHLRPEIIVENGMMHVGKKYRGKYANCVFKYLEEKLSSVEQYSPDCMFLSHSLTDPQLLQEVKAAVERKRYFTRVVEHPVTAGIACHCGPNTFGLFFLRKKV